MPVLPPMYADGMDLDRLMIVSTTNDRVTAMVTRRPACATTRTSTPRPRAAMEVVVRIPATVATGLTATSGIKPVERATRR